MYDKSAAAGGIWWFLGGSLLLAALLQAGDTARFLRQARVTSGEVVALEARVSEEGGVAYEAVFAFTTQSGRALTFRSWFASSPAAYDVGERVRVGYLESAPAYARVMTAAYVWGPTLLTGTCGLILTAIGAGNLRRLKAERRWKRPREGEFRGNEGQESPSSV